MTGAQLTIPTTRFGTLETAPLNAANLFTFPEALPGLPDSHRFGLIEDPAYVPLCWLQSLDEPQVCLPVVPLGALSLGDYAAQAGCALGLDDAVAAVQVMLVTRYDGQTQGFVANMLAPIMLDPETGMGRQVVLEGHSYPLRQTLQWDPGQRTFGLPC